MSWQDRPYAWDSEEARPTMRLDIRRPTTVVGWLLAINIAVFFLDTLTQNFQEGLTHRVFGLRLKGLGELMLWQPVTYMFFHYDVWHLVFNMIGLWIFGREFERAFGPRRFLRFYGTCGVVGGLAYLLFSLVRPEHMDIPLIGASGAIYGLLIAAVIFFPHIQVIFFIFPMPIRVFALIIAGILLLQLISPGGTPNPGGEVCHIAGAATALLVFRKWGMIPRVEIGGISGPGPLARWRERRRQGAWARRQEELRREQAEVDRILAKVSEQGLASLTSAEKKTLQRATRRQQEQDRRSGRLDRL